MNNSYGNVTVMEVSVTDLLLGTAIVALITAALFIVVVHLVKRSPPKTQPRPTRLSTEERWEALVRNHTFDKPSGKALDLRIVNTGRGTVEGMPLFVGIASRTGPTVRYRRDPVMITPPSED